MSKEWEVVEIFGNDLDEVTVVNGVFYEGALDPEEDDLTELTPISQERVLDNLIQSDWFHDELRDVEDFIDDSKDLLKSLNLQAEAFKEANPHDENFATGALKLWFEGGPVACFGVEVEGHYDWDNVPEREYLVHEIPLEVYEREYEREKAEAQVVIQRLATKWNIPCVMAE